VRTLPELVAAEIRAELGRKAMTQTALARRLGVSDMWVSRRLSDGTSLEVGDLERIADVLNVAVVQFLPASERAA
jgi:transcriptional regulator with XRE-family HTH domain